MSRTGRYRHPKRYVGQKLGFPVPGVIATWENKAGSMVRIRLSEGALFPANPNDGNTYDELFTGSNSGTEASRILGQELFWLGDLESLWFDGHRSVVLRLAKGSNTTETVRSIAQAMLQQSNMTTSP